MSFYADNPDLRFHVEQGIDWGRFVPLWEEGFRAQDGPGSLADARELYGESLRAVGDYAEREIAPRARAIDAAGVGFEAGEVVHAPELLRNIDGLRRLGVLAPNLPRGLGGLNFPFTASMALYELLSRACTNTFLLYAFHQGPALQILRSGGPEQVERWVRPLAEGAISGSVAMTEPDAGSDLGRLQTRAEPHGAAWRLSGRKQFITNGCGDVCVVLARSEPGSSGLAGLSLFVAPRRSGERENFRVARPERKMVIRGSATCELAFEGSCAELLGVRGAGFRQILSFMNESRLAVAAQGLGLCQAALAAARGYAERRVQMDRPIARHELVADMLLDMEAETAALRALVFRCSSLQDRLLGLERAGGARRGELEALRRAVRDRTPLAKWFGAERTLWITRAAVQVHGGYGVMTDYDVERHWRNALILPIYEGTSQIQALMSLKDQLQWGLERPWRLASGPVAVAAAPDTLGDTLREMACEYNRALRFAARASLGAAGLIRALGGRRELPRERMAYAFACAERLAAMLAYTRAAEALCAHAGASPRQRRLAERFVHRSLPLLRMHGEIVRSGERSALEALPS